MIDHAALETLCRHRFSQLDRQLATLVCGPEREPPDVFAAVALVSNMLQQGHVCLSLPHTRSITVLTTAAAEEIACPPPADWAAALLRHDKYVGRPGTYRPLILDENNRLYLHRYWYYEDRFRQWLSQRVAAPAFDIDPVALRTALDRYFPEPTASEPDWQRVAAATAVMRTLCIISGGPGTGKTTTVARILALLIENSGDEPLRIAVAAQTGKAAGRIQETLAAAREILKLPAPVAAALPESAHTIHRLLGYVPNRRKPRFHRDNPLPFDVIVIDEASMLDLSLTARLIDAVPDAARVILLGDKDQLASVQPGSVFGDICNVRKINTFTREHHAVLSAATGVTLPEAASAEAGDDRIRDCIVSLSRNYRFAGSAGIYRISSALASGDIETSINTLTCGLDDVEWLRLPKSANLRTALTASISSGFSACGDGATADEIFAEFQRFRVLCALRKGPYGSVAINRIVEDILAAAGVIDHRNPWYECRPVMITENDYGMQLFNGDVGVAMRTAAGQPLQVVFPTAAGGYRRLAPPRLPAHETCFAMTVHKSQGSEFDDVLLVLPDRPNQVLTRELLYTGITRARRRVTLMTSESIFLDAARNRVVRYSGMQTTA